MPTQYSWNDYIEMFPADQQNVIQSLRITYANQYGVVEFNDFEQRFDDQSSFFDELSNIPADSEFIISLGQWLKTKTFGLPNWEPYTGRFVAYATNFATVYSNFYQEQGTSIEEFQNLPYTTIGSDIVESLPSYDSGFWNYYIDILNNRYEALRQQLRITRQPQSLSGCPGEMVSLTVETNREEVVYQWSKNQQNIPGATNKEYDFELAASDNHVTITVLVSSGEEFVLSEPAVVTVGIPEILQQPKDVSAQFGSDASLSILVAGEQISYQWRKAGIPLKGQTNPVLTLKKVQLQDAAQYDCVVSSLCQSIISEKATLTVLDNYIVRGKIIKASRTPAIDYRVKAYHYDNGERYLLGDVQTDVNGNYLIPFTAEQFGLEWSGKANLFIEVTSQGINQKSPLILGADRTQVINVITAKQSISGINEYAQLKEWFDQNASTFDWGNVQEQDVETFSKRSKFPQKQVKAYSQAMFISLSPENVEGYYGLIRTKAGFASKDLLNIKPQDANKALTLAKERNFIAANFNSDDSFSQTLDNEFAVEVETLIETDLDNDVKKFLDLVDFQEAPLATKLRFFELYRQHQESSSDFWTAVADQLSPYAENLQLISQMAAVTSSNLTLMSELNRTHILTNAKDLAQLSKSDIETGILNAGDPIPSYIKGNTIEERRYNYALWISGQIEETYPTPYMQARIAENPEFPSHTDFGAFFESNATFELGKEPVHQYLANNPEALADIPDPEAFTDQLLKLQRFHTIAPRNKKAEVTTALFNKNYESAPQIASTHYDTFIAEFTEEIGEPTASQVYASAREVTARAISFAGKYNQGLNATEFRLVRSNKLDSYSAQIKKMFPNIETLLGETDYCACEHCKSIFGPAAYLVDLLQFCQRIKTGTLSLYQMLTQVYGALNKSRRGDMRFINLNCDNTNVQLPEIDIINELLCDLVHPSFPDARQTTGTAEELRIAPQYPPTNEINAILSAEVFPWSLPFDYFSRSVILQLPIVGTSKGEIAWKLPKAGGNISPDQELQNIRTIGSLAISEITWHRLKMDPFNQNSTYNVSEGVTVKNYFENGGNLLVKKLIDHLGLTFNRFKELLKTAALNPYQTDGTRKYTIFYTGTGCSLGNARISGVQNFYNRLYYLEKISSALDWQLSVADLFIRGNNILSEIDTPNPQILADALERAALLKKLAQKINSDLSSVLSWFTVLNTSTYKEDEATQFETLYLNPAIGYTYTDIEKNGLALNKERTEIASPVTLKELKNAILSSLQMEEKVFDALVNSDWIGSNGDLSEATLSRLTQFWGYAELARALHLNMEELVPLWKGFANSSAAPITNTNQSIEQLIKFVDFVELLKKSPFSSEELIGLFTPKDLEKILPVAEITVWLGQLRDSLKNQWEQTIGNLEGTQPGIHFLLDTQTVNTVTDIDSKNFDLIIIGGYDNTQQLDLTNWWNKDFPLVDDTTIPKNAFVEKIIAIDSSPGASYLEDKDDRIKYIFNTFYNAILNAGKPFIDNVFTTYSNQFALQEFISHFLGDFPNISPLQNRLLTNVDYLKAPNNPNVPILEVFTDKNLFVDNPDPLVPENFPLVYSAYKLIFKNLLFLSKFNHIERYYQLFYTHVPAHWPQPASFPIETGEPAISLAGLQKVWELNKAEKNLSLDKSELFLMLLQAHKGELTGADETEERLSLLSGWPLAEITHLNGTAGFNFTGNYYLRSEWIFRLVNAFEIAGKQGVLPSAMQTWNKMSLSKDDASAIQQAIRKQLSGSTGTDKLIEVNDYLREALRNALLGYTIYKMNVLNGQLFEKSGAGMSDFLLIDVQRSACGMTSRIKQALSAIQMLVQRALLGLERISSSSTFEVPSEPATEWTWRKNYRVWEANRKVFMYPENWLLNETRDDQTQLYQNFVEELSQSNITDESARRAVTNYLRSLSEMANLEISQIYQEEDDNDNNVARKYVTNTVHIFARTKVSPHKYYYRKWMEDAYFTPWEELPFQIEGNHLIPTKYSGRLWLFWPIFIKKDGQGGTVETKVPAMGQTYNSPQPVEKFEIRIAWTTAFRGQWQPKNISKKAFVVENKQQWDFKEKYFYFYTAINQDKDLVLTPVFYPIGTQAGDNYATFQQYMKFTGSISQPELIEGEAEPPTQFPLSNGEQVNMKNEFEANEAIPRLGSGPFQNETSRYRLITSVSNSFATLPQQFPSGEVSAYAFFFEDRHRSFLASPEAPPLSLMAVSDSTMGAIGATIERSITAGITQPLARGGGRNSNLAPITQASPISGDSGEIYYGSGSSNQTIVNGDTPPTSGDGNSPIILEPVDPTNPEDSITPILPTHRFYANYHPYAEDFFREVNRYGLEGIYQPLQKNLKRQLAQNNFDFKKVYQPSRGVINKFPIEDIDFNSFGAYSVYNWELFLHIPLTVAQMLTSNYRFAEAQQWLHYIFDPTESEGETPQRFWKIKPLFQFSGLNSQQELENFVDGQDENLQRLVKLWEKDPFNPHLIARFRISTYMRRVIMVYIENLIAWADQLFTSDSIESINEAFQLYMLAWRILGERPKKLHPREQEVKNINELIGTGTNRFNILAQLSDGLTTKVINTSVIFNTARWKHPAHKLAQYPAIRESISRPTNPIAAVSRSQGLLQNTTNLTNVNLADQPLVGSQQSGTLWATWQERYNPAADQFVQAAEAMNTLGYFCVLPNTQMYDYWDTVEDRLHKLRNCLNIEGERRSLDLFEPPIDPGAIIAALASGMSLSSAINGLTAPLPYYRFRYLIDRSLALVQEVKGLGQAMLSALEKADAQELSLLREQHQQNVLDAVRQVKIQAVEAAKASLLALQAQQENVKYREQFYRSRKYTITEEENYIKEMQKSNSLASVATGLNLVSGVLSAIPEFSIGVNGAFGSPHASAKMGGYMLAAGTRVAAQALQAHSGMASTKAGIENTKGGWKRRQDDWLFQAESAKNELSQIDGLILAENARFEMAQRDLVAHDRQIANAVQTQQVIDTQFANRNLYMWMRSELSSLYRTAYNEALTLAKQTQQCFHYELWDNSGPRTSSYITTDHWDGLKKGLLSGEKLERQLRNMQKSYDDQNERLFELKKNVPLSEIDPGALLKLKQTGKTAFSIPEFLFDLDYAGQYQRRIKSVAITIPCVAGPYGNITARLSLTGNLVRKNTTLINGEYKKQETGENRFQDGISPSQALATTIGTSSANRDSGLFQLNFNDERYLPFEGAGAISDWVLELPTAYKQFDYRSISDVILHIDYTARENSGTFKNTVNIYLQENLNAAIQGGWNELISMKAQFSDAFYKFLNPAPEQTNLETEFGVTNKQFPYIFNGVDTKITEITLLIQLKEGVDPSGNAVNAKLGETDHLPGFKTLQYGSNSDDKTYHLLYASFDYSTNPIIENEKNLTLRITSDATSLVTTGKVEDVMLLISFGKV